VGAETQDSFKKNPLHNLFNPCGHEVDVLMGYGANPLTLMLRGNFVTMEPSFPSSGGSTLSVRGLNILHKLRTSRHTYAWEKQRPSEIAKSFPDLPLDKEPNKKRFPLPVDIEGNDVKNETPIEYIAQSNQFDIEFLLALARRAGYVIFVKEEEKKGNTVVKERRLFFGPSDGNHPGFRLVTFELKWGLSLIDFKPTLTTANQIKSVTVNGWDRKTKQPIRGTASIETLTLNRDLRENFESCDQREERVEDEPVFTQDEANKKAKDLLKERSKDLVKASGSCIGLPELRAGQRVVIGNLGSRFSGQYFITDTVHTISDSGYVTKFNGRREDPDKE
jgi:phage protein D